MNYQVILRNPYRSFIIEGSDIAVTTGMVCITTPNVSSARSDAYVACIPINDVVSIHCPDVVLEPELTPVTVRGGMIDRGTVIQPRRLEPIEAPAINDIHGDRRMTLGGGTVGRIVDYPPAPAAIPIGQPDVGRATYYDPLGLGNVVAPPEEESEEEVYFASSSNTERALAAYPIPQESTSRTGNSISITSWESPTTPGRSAGYEQRDHF